MGIRALTIFNGIAAAGLAAADPHAPFEQRCVPNDPIVARPSSVLELHPAHIAAVGVFGDSISAGFAARAFFPLEFRGSSFSGGRGFGLDDDSEGQADGASVQHTVPYLVRHYRPNLTGFSEESMRVPTEADIPFRYLFAGEDHLNVAVSGAETRHWASQLRRFESQFEELEASGVSLKDQYKLVTVFLGENDLCQNFESCGNEEEQDWLVNRFARNLDELLHMLTRKYSFLYINLVELFWTSGLLKVESAHWRCTEFERMATECLCIHTGNSASHNRTNWKNAQKLDIVSDRMNAELRRLAAKYDWAIHQAELLERSSARAGQPAPRGAYDLTELPFVPRPDVGVNVIRAAQHEPIPSLDYLSKLDCFHPSLKAHSMMAHATWNSMLGASEGPLNFKNNTNFVPACAAPNTSLVTWGTKHLQASRGEADTISVGSLVTSAEGASLQVKIQEPTTVIV